MANQNSQRDDNDVSTLLAISSVDGVSTVALWANPINHRLLVDNANTGLTVGTSTITSGTTTRILYDNAGILGEYTITGTGTVVAMATSPVFTTPTIGAAIGTSLQLSGLTASQILITDGSKNIVSADTATYPSLTELAFVKGVTSAIQTQINAKGAGTVTSVSVTTANGVSGVVATATTTPAITLTLGAITPTTVNGNTFTTGTYTLTGQAGKTLTFNGSITLTGTDAQTYTFPTTTATLARTDAGQTFTGVNNFTSPDITTSITTSTVSFTAFAGATTLLTIGGTGASASLFAPSTLDTSSSVTGAIRTSGGISAAKSANIGTTLTVGTGYQIGGAATSGKILKGNGTNFVASTETYATPGTSGNLMTSDGANWTSAPPSGGTPVMRFSTMFETAARFNVTTAGSGTNGFDNGGILMTTTASAGGRVSVACSLFSGSPNLMLGSPTFTATIGISPIGTTAQAFIGIDVPTLAAGGITFTNSHIGFKILVVASVASLYATQADDTTENASSALTTIATTDCVDLIAVVNGSTSVSYYWRKNGGTLSSATVLTGNVPTTSGQSPSSLGFEITNASTASSSALRVSSCSYQR